VGEDRVAQALRVARELLDAEGEAALSMRRLAEGMGIRAPSLYKHVPDKATLEVALIADGLAELGATLAAARQSLPALARAYRAWAIEHRHLYALMTERPLPRERLPEHLEREASAPLLAAAGGEHRARALWAAAHGLVALEAAQRFPADADLDAAWAALVNAFER
jgi:AcrR family transcriptional regulator